MTKRGLWRNTAKRIQIKRQAATKRCQETNKKRARKSAATQGENAEIFVKKALKIRKKINPLNT